MDADEILEQINRQRGTSYKIVGRYAQGESGAASQVSDEHGSRYMLKIDAADNSEFRAQHAAHATSRLRRLGYPAPEYIATGSVEGMSYVLQTAMRGKPVRDRVTLAILPQLLHLNDLQRGQGDLLNDEPERIIRGVMQGYAEYCVIDTLRTYSAESAAMLDSLQRIVTAHGSECPKRNDIVHFDFHTNNVLIEGDHVTGVIDWEGSESGDCAFDLATMLFYAWPFEEFREQLMRALLERTTRGAAAIYLAHMIVRQLDWSMRHHPREAVDRYMNTARAMMRVIGAM